MFVPCHSPWRTASVSPGPKELDALSMWEQQSAMRVVAPARPRKLAKVPFVELADGRVQGVVSSGSDVERVYVSSISAGAHAFACSTNNNRPCGGARGYVCNHIRALVDEAVLQYGFARVARYLRAETDAEDGTGSDVIRAMDPKPSGDGTAAAAPVFSRFLRHLAYLELDATTAPLPELQWFPPAAKAVA
jgi:hypothetical protein